MICSLLIHPFPLSAKLPGRLPLHSMHLTVPSSFSNPIHLLPFLSSHNTISNFTLNPTMKLTKIFSKSGKLFRSKKPRSVSSSESDPSSFSPTSSSSEEATVKKPIGLSTSTTVLPTLSPEIEWSEISADIHFELKQAFEMIDRDNDGKVKKEELEALLCRIGGEQPSSEELKMMLNEVDRDGDGCITLEEFYAIRSAFAPPSCDSELKEAFDFFDSDRDGKITADELYEVFKTIGDARCTLEECRRMIGEVDQNGDGFVCFEDFSRMMVHQQR